MDFNTLPEGVRAWVMLMTEKNKAIRVQSIKQHGEGKVFSITLDTTA